MTRARVPRVKPPRKRGGRRAGAGAKPIPVEARMISITVRVPVSTLLALTAEAADTGATISDVARAKIDAGIPERFRELTRKATGEGE